LLVVGKLGIHADPELDIGGNAEALLRNVDCAVLLSQRQHQPRVDVVADVTTSWTTEAEKRMKNVPVHALNMVRMAILRFAQERGHTVVTESIVDEATAQLCPANARGVMAEIVAAHDSGELGKDQAAMDEMEWTGSALELLQSVTEPSVRDSIQRRAEKKARRGHMERVEDEHVIDFLPKQETVLAGGCPFAHRSQTELPAEDAGVTWDSAAMQRLQRVPQGFTRTLTQQRVEVFARRRGASVITAELLEEKYAEWAAGSAKESAHLRWADSAWQRIQQIPEFVRGMVIKEMEHCAQQLGVNTVTTDVMAHARESWSDTGIFHSESAPMQYMGDGAREE
jgi:hypothetical protein